MPGPGLLNDGYESDDWHDEQDALRAARLLQMEKPVEQKPEVDVMLDKLQKLSGMVANAVVNQTEWKPDCQGKADFDITLFSLSSRSYPDNTAYGTLYLSTEGGRCVDGIAIAEFHSEPGKHLGAPNAQDELKRMANEHIQKFVYALLRITDPKVVEEAAKKAGL